MAKPLRTVPSKREPAQNLPDDFLITHDQRCLSMLMGSRVALGGDALSTLPRPTPQRLQLSDLVGGGCCIDWLVDGWKLYSNDHQVASPAFEVYGVRFRMLLQAKADISGRRGVCFKKAAGWGDVCLKCEGRRVTQYFLSPLGPRRRMMVPCSWGGARQ